MQVVGHDLQVVLFQQRLGDGFGGGTDVDEHGGVVVNLCLQGFGYAFFCFQIHDLASLVGGIDGARIDACATVVPAQFLLFGKVIQIASDGLGSYVELVNQLLSSDKTVFLDHLHDQILPAPLCHATFLRSCVNVPPRACAAELKIKV